jgi:hypothetical protein
MGYETYDQISWSDGTPLTSDRLQQMSTNISLVKSVTDGYSKGILSWNEMTTPPSTIDDFGSHIVIQLHLDTTPTPTVDRRVTVESNRFLKITFTTPGIVIGDGDEDTKYFYQLRHGTALDGQLKQEFMFVPEGGDIINSHTDIDPATGNKYLGGGTFSVLIDSLATGITSQDYTMWIGRTGSGTGSVYRPYMIGGAKIQLWAEDCGTSLL